MPTNEEVLKCYDILKKCAISEKRWHEEGEKFFGEHSVGKKGFKGWMKRFIKVFSTSDKYIAVEIYVLILGRYLTDPV